MGGVVLFAIPMGLLYLLSMVVVVLVWKSILLVLAKETAGWKE